MANFFGKKALSTPQAISDSASSSKLSTSQSDFDKTFKPFMLKKDVELAPINFFMRAKENGGNMGQSQRNAIIVDFEEEMKQIDDTTTECLQVDVSQMDERGLSSDIAYFEGTELFPSSSRINSIFFTPRNL